MNADEGCVIIYVVVNFVLIKFTALTLYLLRKLRAAFARFKSSIRKGEKMKNSGFIAYRSFHTPLDTIEQFNNEGYNTVCVFPAHTVNSIGTPYSQYPPTWLWYDKFDFTPFDRMVEDVLSVMPEAKILLMVDLNAPAWLEHNNQKSCSDSFLNLGKAVQNPIWVEATETYLKNFVEYANKKYGERIAAYVLACGATDEWYDYSNGSESSERRAAWRSYQLSHGRPDPIDIPPESVREHVTHDNFLRDPKTDGLALQYWHFCNESIADTIMRFAQDTREIVGDKAKIGCFYGYILEKGIGTLVSCGHLAYERVLDCADIDFLISPGTYRDRQIGGGSGFLIPSGSAAVRGKKLLHECDQHTHTSNHRITPYIYFNQPRWPDEKSTVAGIKRETALGLIKRTHLWWFDMWGGFYQGEKVMKCLADAKKLWDEISSTNAVDACEVAMVVDAESTYFVNQLHENTPKINLGTRNKLNKLGAPYEVYSFNDVPKIKNFDRYKLVIFTSLFDLTPEKRSILDEYVLKDGRSVLWLYAPGIVTDGEMNKENCEKLSGISYCEKGVAKRKTERFTSYYIHNYDELTPAVLKKIAKDAGVMINVEEELPVYAEGNLLAIHTKDGGKITVTVDERYSVAEDLFTGKRTVVERGKFVYDFSAPDTALFRLEI